MAVTKQQAGCAPGGENQRDNYAKSRTESSQAEDRINEEEIRHHLVQHLAVGTLVFFVSIRWRMNRFTGKEKILYVFHSRGPCENAEPATYVGYINRLKNHSRFDVIPWQSITKYRSRNIFITCNNLHNTVISIFAVRLCSTDMLITLIIVKD